MESEEFPEGYQGALRGCSGLAADLLKRVLSCTDCADYHNCRRAKKEICREFAASSAWASQWMG
jgi:hypothetical protein